ncbi:MAG TPA: hypothetical protein VE338_19765 [Ktedonobacterales bacterium]|jgi:hypothetical protein|nr:hypothetical protein [Ktedonobacterales bacterium]
MIWAIWRQHRAEALIVGITLAALAAILAFTGAQIAATYQSLGVGPCLALNNTNPNCGQIVGAFRDQFDWLQSASEWLNLTPVFVGILIGAPLVAREVEQRTHLLAWTQSVTRRRWLTSKLVFIVGGALLASAILTALLIWWRGPFDLVNGRMAPGGFDLEGTVPLAYMVFALALAIAAGALLRRTIPAMVVTLAAFLAVRLPLDNWARPYLYQAPVSLNVAPLASAGPTRGDWELAFGFVDHTGRPLVADQVYATCASAAGPGSKLNFFQCVQAHGWLVSYVYQPAARFWRFQITETLIYLALTVALLALTYWWTLRRIR